MKVLRMESTPNPSAMKFVLDGNLLSSGSRHYDHAPASGDDAFAARLFSIPSIDSVFYMDNFITLDKTNGPDWQEVEKQIDQILSEGHQVSTATVAEKPSDDERLNRINEVLDAKVRPALAGDGGGLEVIGLKDGNLVIRYQGACGTCPSSIQGTLYAIQNLLRSELQEEINVIAG